MWTKQKKIVKKTQIVLKFQQPVTNRLLLVQLNFITFEMELEKSSRYKSLWSSG